MIEENLLSEVEAGCFHVNVDMSIVANELVGRIEQLTVAKLWTGQNTATELADEVVKILLYGLTK